MAKLFTEEELAEQRRADEELDEEFCLTPEDLQFSRQLDREARLQKLDNRGRKIAEYQAAYREANKDKIAEYQAAYREANKDKIAEYQAAYVDAIDQFRMRITAVRGNEITGATIIADMAIKDGKPVYRLVDYTLEGGVHTMLNRAATESGSPVELTEIPEWASIEPEIVISNVEHILFGFLKCPTDSREDAQRYGVPITYGANDKMMRQTLTHEAIISGHQAGQIVSSVNPWGTYTRGYIKSMESTLTQSGHTAQVEILGTEVTEV